MKKINFASLFGGENRLHQRMVRLQLIIFGSFIMVLSIVHGMQLLSWYRLWSEYRTICTQEPRYRSATDQYKKAEEKKKSLHDKMAVLRSHRYTQEAIVKKLAVLLAIPQEYANSVHMTSEKFEIAITVPTKNEAFSLFRSLKKEPLVQKVRMRDMSFHEGNYDLSIEGQWK